jgi:hypothetical protein
MFNVQGYPRRRHGAQLLDRVGRRPPCGRPAVLTPRKLIETATITAGARARPRRPDRLADTGKRADIVPVRKGPFGDSPRRRLRPRPAADQPARHRHGASTARSA